MRAVGQGDTLTVNSHERHWPVMTVLRRMLRSPFGARLIACE
jgi:hypothetical protein